MAPPIRVLYVEDDSEVADAVCRELESRSEQITVTTERTTGDAMERLSSETASIDCILSGSDLPGADGLSFLTSVREDHPHIPFILYPDQGSEAMASEAITAGVTEYVKREDSAEHIETLAERIETTVAENRDRKETAQTSRYLRELTNSTTDCFWMFDRDWEELHFISGYEAVWERPTAKIRENPQDFLNGVHPEDRAFVKQAMKTLSSGDSVDIEYRIQKEGGETGWVWVKGQPIFDDSGAVVRVVGFVRDVTARKERKRELELRNEAINEAPIGIVITDPAQEDNPVVYANDHFLELIGYPREEVLGRNCRFLQGPETRDEAVAELRTAIDENESVTVELQNYRKDGSLFWNRVSIAPVYDESGGVRNYIGFQEDITDRKQRQRQLQMVDRVLRHNLRNDMNVIRNHAERLTHQDNVDTRETATAIVEKVDELVATTEKERLIAQLLSDPMQRRDVALYPVLSGILSRLEQQYEDAVITLDYPDEETLDAPQRIGHAVEELVVNAIEHNDNPTPEVAVTVESTDEHCSITVADNGPPIPEMERNILLGGEETPLYHGSGLGLWLVYTVTSQVGGTVRYDVTDPNGNEIELVLPG